MQLSTLLTAATLACVAVAHPGPHAHIPRAEMARRADLSSKCSNKVARFNEKRWKRSLAKRSSSGNSTFQITTEAPHYQTIQNETCVLAPEVTEGPYWWPESQTLRQDMTEGQSGVPLWLDVGVLDMATCEPLEDVLVDFWHCNATGSYSSFTGLSPNTPFETLLKQLNVSDYGMGSTDLHTDDTTFLRGMWPTDKNGMMEMKTVFPGFYVERAIHIHVQVHTDWSLRGNGTMAYGDTISTGQLYFDEALERKIMALEPYVSHTEINRTTNAVDSVFSQGLDGGYNPVISVEPVDGEDVTKGMVGYVTIGVDTTAVESFGKR
ncbi:intradiol ring-cleavage dioxygenase [Aspergillus glaucus CBS 516.65]|uniref:Intradiol ring-cleavage dioxygenases domain-containing protein n=1 Tax=Aspergillus glaucus CBS 516.65 TaxID=1160497 RepID=A0A1L9VX77_ASPGL|nr:hypothetical protein ASPGLDRAFT_162960 [Aspergillus glaucus CBS 516.65]OJJ88524.1 hypothetical protein ASPGLDRAFT_162960 [Aspergillus glaucus CBS 516.65]